MEPRESTRHDQAYVKFKSNPVHGDEARMGWRGMPDRQGPLMAMWEEGVHVYTLQIHALGKWYPK